MTLAFGILTSRESPASVGQLIDALSPYATVWVHHDRTKGPPPAPSGGDVHFVRDAVQTGWGEWSLCAAILATLRTALEDPDWRYFQLLSGSCLPIRPVDEFVRYVESSPTDVNADLVALDDDEIALMSHGFRAYAPQDTLQHRVLRRLRRWYLGGGDGTVLRDGLSFALPEPGHAARPSARLALEVMRRAESSAAPTLGHPFGNGLRCYVGSTWWGAQRRVCEYLVDQPEDGPLQRYFQRVLIPDEFYFQTLIGNAHLVRGKSNHAISRFDDAHPVRLEAGDLPGLRGSKRFFARKFSDDPLDAARLEVLGHLAAAQPGARAHRPFDRVY